MQGERIPKCPVFLGLGCVNAIELDNALPVPFMYGNRK